MHQSHVHQAHTRTRNTEHKLARSVKTDRMRLREGRFNAPFVPKAPIAQIWHSLLWNALEEHMPTRRWVKACVRRVLLTLMRIRPELSIARLVQHPCAVMIRALRQLHAKLTDIYHFYNLLIKYNQKIDFKILIKYFYSFKFNSWLKTCSVL